MRSTSIPGLTRIVCPSCQAVYEVPAAAIPPGGRDVQCSACAHNWYQLAAGNAASAPQAAGAGGVREAAVSAGLQGAGGISGADRLERMRAALRQPGGSAPWPGASEPDEATAAPSAVAGFAETVPMPFGGTGISSGLQGGDPGEEPEFDLPLPPRRRLDPQVLDVLRSEAETEAQARRRDVAGAVGAPIETQGELPLPPRPRRSAAEVRDRLARLQDAERGGGQRWTAAADLPSDPPEADPAAPGVAGPRGFPPLPPLAAPLPPPEPEPRAPAGEAWAFASDRVADRRSVDLEPPPETRLFQRAAPDRLRAEPAARPRSPAAASQLPVRVSGARSTALALRQTQAARRRGFRIGFAAPVTLAAAALALYLAAPRLMEAVPAAAPALSEVVRQGDAVQATLAARVREMLVRLAPAGES